MNERITEGSRRMRLTDQKRLPPLGLDSLESSYGYYRRASLACHLAEERQLPEDLREIFFKERLDALDDLSCTYAEVKRNVGEDLAAGLLAGLASTAPGATV